jgi:hypothetical protein
MPTFNLPAESLPRFAVGIMAIAWSFACGPPRYSPPIPPASDPAAVLEAVRRRENAIRSLRATFKATASHESGQSDVQGVLLVRKPDRFRMRLMLPFGITVMDYVCHADRAWTLLPLAQDEDAEEARLFSPADVRETFQRGAAAFPGTCSATNESAPVVEVACRSCDACPLLRSLRLDGRSGTISAETSYADGQPRLVTRYEDYREIDGLPLPFHIVMAYPARRLRVEIHVRSYEVNPELKDALFRPPQGARLETGPVPLPVDS